MVKMTYIPPPPKKKRYFFRNFPVTPTPEYFPKSTAVQMGGVLPYKWEVYCWVSLSSRLRSQEGPAIQMGGVLPYKWGAYCRTNWRCTAVLSSRPVGVGVSETLLIFFRTRQIGANLKIILTTPTPHISKRYGPKICHKMRGRMAYTSLEIKGFHRECGTRTDFYGIRIPTFMAYESRLLHHMNRFYWGWGWSSIYWQSRKIRFSKENLVNSVLCCFSWEILTKSSPNLGLVNELSATPRGHLNWTGPIANSSDFWVGR